MKNNKYVFCDFDGTLTYFNSFIFLMISLQGFLKVILNLIKLIPDFILFKFKFISNREISERLLFSFFKNKHLSFFDTFFKYEDFLLDKIIRKKVLKFLLLLQKKEFTVIIVSASSDLWLKKWCLKYNFELISNSNQFDNNLIYMKSFKNKYCWGIEKINYINKRFSIDYDNDFIIALGDTKGDKYILKVADYKIYKPTNLNIQKHFLNLKKYSLF